jgi:ribokinase
MPDVVVVGGIFREVIGRQDDHEPEIRLAGSALTAAVAASRVGASVAIGSFVGSEDAESAHALLEHASVETCLVTLDGASGTFAYGGDADADDPHPLYRPAETCPTALPLLPDARILLVFGVPDFDPVRDPAVHAVAATASTLIWDRQGWLSRTRDARAATALESPDRVLLVNAGEAIDESVLDPRTGEVQLPTGYDRGVVKDGARGALVVESASERRQLVPAYPVRASSTVGSGDVFGGVVAARLAAGDDLVAAARQAAAATSIILAGGDTFAPPDLQKLTRKLLAESDGELDWRWPFDD